MTINYLINLLMILNTIKPLILSGPSGSGKTTLISHLLQLYPKSFKLCVSHTTRIRRPIENDGFHYYYVSKEIFKSMIDKNEFLEYEVVHKKFYGTSIKEISRIIGESKIPVLDIDIRGALNIHQNCKLYDPNYLFITTKEIESLRNRLLKRGTETEENIKIRINNAQEEIQKAVSSKIYKDEDFVYNEDLEETKTNFLMKIKGLYTKTLEINPEL